MLRPKELGRFPVLRKWLQLRYTQIQWDSGACPLPVEDVEMNEKLPHSRTSRITLEGHLNNKPSPNQRHRWIESAYVYAKITAGVLLVNSVLVIHDNSSGQQWMQSLASPTRPEVDREHRHGRWLDIGVSSIKNLRVVGRSQCLMWLLLLVTATPFHFLYNSVVFQASATNEYAIILAPSDVGPENIYNLTTSGLKSCFEGSVEVNWDKFASDISNQSFKTLSRDESVEFTKQATSSGVGILVGLSVSLNISQGGDRSILHVQTNAETTEVQPIVSFQSDGLSSYRFSDQIWAFDVPFGDSVIAYDPSNFTLQSCLENTVASGNSTICQDVEDVVLWLNRTEPETIHEVNQYINANLTSNISAHHSGETCLLYSPALSFVVIIAALIKVFVMFQAARLGRYQPEPLITIGDAVASFIAEPDLTTVGHCTLSISNIRQRRWPTPNTASGQPRKTSTPPQAMVPRSQPNTSGNNNNHVRASPLPT
ncbi:hypothetical protein BO78DRAFT_422680 [Aspergillus sclerotiicarbonarius CBS 121057]|uniref:DUF6536 domain-containing protein n=1 Tax=Aspergillus sclerotiicarbonarius (strain CBS 121057 / IBT 28362) TaxID=1448318 RepID=A0A319ENH9_ASPSB|nr:hypothetical protein BO78DRAFT_422680 [Aspergillus sclerotiicarbonarius CBS 121057]